LGGKEKRSQQHRDEERNRIATKVRGKVLVWIGGLGAVKENEKEKTSNNDESIG